MSKVEYDSVWDALSDTYGEAENMKARAQLMRQISKIIGQMDLTQKEAAKQAGITQPRLNDLLRGRISKFSLDALINVASALGQSVQIKLKAA